MEKYSKAASERHSQLKKREPHPLEKYIGRSAKLSGGEKVKVVGHTVDTLTGGLLIVDASVFGGWHKLHESDAVFKRCKAYRYVVIEALID